jgi:hypothetical protein
VWIKSGRIEDINNSWKILPEINKMLLKIKKRVFKE